MLHPEVQKRIQNELDQRIGAVQLPTMQDIDALVYLKAAVKESMRFNVATPLGTKLSLIWSWLTNRYQECNM
jgi:hypothetical protein